jgi:enoyl-CoA hydratase/carnithine racemase
MAQVVLHDGWGELILSRPARKNALVGPMVADLQAGLATLLAGGAKAIVLRGAEGVFCSGLDVDAFAEDPAPAWRASWPQDWAAWHKALYRCPAVIICAMEKYTINAGASMALAADLLVAGETSTLLVGEAALGMLAPMNIAWLRLRTTEAVAAQLTLGARRTGAADLYRLGLAYEVVPDNQTAARACELAATLGGYRGQALAGIKAALRAGRADGGEAVFDAVQSTGFVSAAPGRIAKS